MNTASRFKIIDTAKPVSDTRITEDPATGLQWQTVCFDKKMTFKDAEKACRELRLGGHDDWRLPTRAELLTLVDDTRHSPAIDGEAFPGTPSEWFWTSTSYAANNDLAWVVGFGNGDSGIYGRDGSARVRAVRGPVRQ